MTKTVSIRMDEDLKNKVQKLADKEKRSLSKQIILILEKGIKK